MLKSLSEIYRKFFVNVHANSLGFDCMTTAVSFLQFEVLVHLPTPDTHGLNYEETVLQCHFYEPCLRHIDNWIGSEVPLCSVSNQASFIRSFNSLAAFNCIWMIFVSEVCDVNPLFDFSFIAQEASPS